MERAKFGVLSQYQPLPDFYFDFSGTAEQNLLLSLQRNKSNMIVPTVCSVPHTTNTCQEVRELTSAVITQFHVSHMRTSTTKCQAGVGGQPLTRILCFRPTNSTAGMGLNHLVPSRELQTWGNCPENSHCRSGTTFSR